MELDRVKNEMLVLRTMDGESRALNELIDRWQERLWRHALRLVGDEDAAWDILQEACLAIGRGIRNLQHESAFPAWAYLIVGNKCRDWIRRRVRDRRRDELAAWELQRRDGEDEDRRARVANLKEAMERLSGPDRALLSLRYEEEFGLAEIARILGVPEGTVKSRLHHVKQRLKKLMEDRQS